MQPDSQSEPLEHGVLTFQLSRRLFLTCLAMSAAPAVFSQPLGRPTGAKVGWLALRESIFRESYSLAFLARLNELGFREGINLVIEKRDPGDKIDLYPEIAKQLVSNRPDVIFGGGGKAGFLALKNASKDVPVVYVSVDFDPVQEGYVKRMSRPDGMMTGVSGNQAMLPAKRLELIKILFPKARKIAVFNNSETAGQLAVVQSAAQMFGLNLEVIDFKTPPFDFEGAYQAVVRSRSDALVILGSSLFVSARSKIPQLALAHRIPTVCHNALWAEAGALMTYGYSFTNIWRIGAEMTARVLRGTPVSEIPMEIPSIYELAINLTTARVLGVQIPYELKLRADRLIT